MQTRVFDAFRRLAYDQAGISLRENKAALVSARIQRRMRSLALASPEQYLAYLERDDSGHEMIEFLDAISTNFTSFFREADHFELLSRSLEDWLDQGMRRLRIWCAAAATGEEPYTIAMTIAETLGSRSLDYRILASDISLRALKHAALGQYEAERVAQVPAAMRAKYFAPRTGADRVQVVPELRSRILWKRINLARPLLPLRGGLDVIFCRNVMIYFDHAVRKQLVLGFERLLRPGGLLIVAHSETLTGIPCGLRPVRPSVYRKGPG